MEITEGYEIIFTIVAIMKFEKLAEAAKVKIRVV